MNEKQQQLTFEKGITNVPSDALCPDNALAESVGMVYDSSEHRVIQKPSAFINSIDGSLVYVHKFAGEERYIVMKDGTMYWGTKGNGNVFTPAGETFQIGTSDNVEVTSVGKTLIISDAANMHYFLWKNGSYTELGNKIPEAEIEFALATGYAATEGGDADGFFTFSSIPGTAYYTARVADGKEKECSDIILGLYASCIKKVKKQKSFAKPFFIRYAVELYDGTYILHSAPIAMFPAITKNCYARYTRSSNNLELCVDGFKVMFKANYDYSDWSDLVKNVVVFASDGISNYDTGEIGSTFERGYNVVDNNVTGKAYNDCIAETQESGNIPKYKEFTIAPNTAFVDFFPLTQRTTAAVLDDMKSASVFYRLFEMGRIRSDSYWIDATSLIKDNVVETLTTQEQLTDDYFSHTQKIGTSTFAYNARLILAGVKRGFFEGFATFLPYSNDHVHTYVVDVTIDTPGGEVTVRKEIQTDEKMGIYFFYPDPRAKKVSFYHKGNGDTYDADYSLVDKTLSEHPFLNGSYFFDHLPTGTEAEPQNSGTVLNMPAIAAVSPEALSNQLFISEANNPFVYKAEGNVSVGTGSIIGVSSITQALSQGQFGQYPMIVFTDEGIYAASIGSTGIVTAVTPMSREVCNNPKSITQTDGAVFFVSKKGLMVIGGSKVEGSLLQCVSEQLSGKTSKMTVGEQSIITDLGNFNEYLANAFIAYDYRDSLLWIFNPFYTTCYVYAIKSGTFGRFRPEARISSVVNNYPDYLLQAGTAVFSLAGRPDINSAAAQHEDYAASMITRTMKLENALALKSIMQIRHIKDMQGTVSLRIFASNNLNNWIELHSLRGTPWKYYRFYYTFANMKATDRFAGTILVTQERRTNKLR